MSSNGASPSVFTAEELKRLEKLVQGRMTEIEWGTEEERLAEDPEYVSLEEIHKKLLCLIQ
jgi:hypothetical protein